MNYSVQPAMGWVFPGRPTSRKRGHNVLPPNVLADSSKSPWNTEEKVVLSEG